MSTAIATAPAGSAASAVPSTPPKPRRLAVRAVIALLWALAGGVAPALAAGILYVLGERAEQLVGLGSLCGMLVGAMVGIRSRSVVGWVLCPAFGYSAGLLDIRVFDGLCRAGWTYRQAALFPAWGALLGLGGALAHRRWLGGMLLVVLGAGADAFARWGWMTLRASRSQILPWPELAWLEDALAYALPALVLAAASARHGSGAAANRPA